MLQAEARWVDDISCDKQLQTTLGAICYTVASLTRHTEKQYDKKKYIHTPYFHARPQFTHFILHKPKIVFLTLKKKSEFFRFVNCSKKWISILNKVDFKNIKTQFAGLTRHTEKQYDKKYIHPISNKIVWRDDN